MALALQNNTLFVPFCHIDLRLRIQQLLAPISLSFHLKLKLTLPTFSTSEAKEDDHSEIITSTSRFAG
jgi:hypothetical protein